MKHTRIRIAWAALLFIPLLASTTTAQPQLPRENHYTMYYATFANQYAKPVALTDQFGTVDFVNGIMSSDILLPTEKILPTGERFPPVDPVVHMLMWGNSSGFAVPQPPRTIVVTDQFGTHKWTTDDAIGFFNPALKNVPAGQPPIWNHYLCYFAFGPDPNRVVTLVDQFGTQQVLLRGGINIFCNPAKKTHLDDGTEYPIVDAKAHLACYSIGTLVMANPVIAIDQFGNWQFEVIASEWFCMPAIKEQVVRTQQSTWGKIKALYH